MKILITGGFGFMGKSIQKAFDGSGYKVFPFSRRNGLDLSLLGNTKAVLQEVKPDVIIHSAAHVGSISYVDTNAAMVIEDNARMYLNLYRALAETGQTNVRVLNPVSNCSYPGIIDVQHESLWESGPIHGTVKSYGAPKRFGVAVAQCYQKQHGIDTSNLIISNAYGPGDYLDEARTHAMNGIVMRMIKAQKAGDSEFVVWGTGSPIREWAFMPDIGNFFRLLVDNPDTDFPDFLNIGQEDGMRIIDTVNTVKDLLEYDVKIVQDTSKKDGAPIKVLGKTNFRKYFPDFQFTDYKEGIRQTIAYYKEALKDDV